MRTRFDRKHSFCSCFDETTGHYIRSGVLSAGRDTGEDPFMSSFPELLDVGIMGHCQHGLSGLCAHSGVQCYQSGGVDVQPNMALEDFLEILRQCQDRKIHILTFRDAAYPGRLKNIPDPPLGVKILRRAAVKQHPEAMSPDYLSREYFPQKYPY